MKLFPKALMFAFLSLFLMPSCSDDDDSEPQDPCEGVVCENGGDCVNGECDCPVNYEGPSCANEKTPVNMFFTSITITRFPQFASDGGNWDPFDGPDIYIKVFDQNENVIHTSGYFEDVSQNSDPTFDVQISISDPQDRYIIRLYEYDDFDSDDYMGGVEFTPYRRGQEFPNRLFLDANGNAAFEVETSYNW